MYICVRAYRHWLNQWLDTDRLSGDRLSCINFHTHEVFMIRFICILLTTTSAVATFLAFREWWVHGEMFTIFLCMTIMTGIGMYTTYLGDHNDM